MTNISDVNEFIVALRDNGYEPEPLGPEAGDKDEEVYWLEYSDDDGFNSYNYALKVIAGRSFQLVTPAIRVQLDADGMLHVLKSINQFNDTSRYTKWYTRSDSDGHEWIYGAVISPISLPEEVLPSFFGYCLESLSERLTDLIYAHLLPYLTKLTPDTTVLVNLHDISGNVDSIMSGTAVDA